jgi:hypothetical protein
LQAPAQLQYGNQAAGLGFADAMNAHQLPFAGPSQLVERAKTNQQFLG